MSPSFENNRRASLSNKNVAVWKSTLLENSRDRCKLWMEYGLLNDVLKTAFTLSIYDPKEIHIFTVAIK